MDALFLMPFVGLLALSAFFSGSETALMTVDRLGLHRRVAEGRATARLILRQREDPHRLLTALLLGNNVVNTAAAALATTVAVRLLGEGRGILVATALVTLLLMVFSEILPKTVAALRPWAFSRMAARPLWWFQRALAPLLMVLDLMTRPVIRLVRRSARGSTAPGMADIRTLFSLARGGDIPERILTMLDRGLHLSQTTAEEIMVPRVQTVMVEQGTPLSEVVSLNRKVGHTRFPVYDGDPDHTTGLLHITDVLSLSPDDWPGTPAGRISRRLLHVPGSTHLHELLRRMQAKATHLAVVVDEYGGTDGIVTLEDILEEVVGTIIDEQDIDREAEITSLGEGRFRVRGTLGLTHLARETGVDLTHPHLTTVAGLIQHLLGRPARPGDRVTHKGYELKAERMSRRCVSLARILRLAPETPEETDTKAR